MWMWTVPLICLGGYSELTKNCYFHNIVSHSGLGVRVIEAVVLLVSGGTAPV
jgi:hypothetical protein